MPQVNREQFASLLNSHVGQFRYRMADRPAEHRKKEEEAIAEAGFTLPINKVIVGERKGIVGRRYSNAVNAERLMEGKPMDFTPVAPKGKEFVQGSAVLMRAVANPTKLYVAIQPVHSETLTEFRDVTGRKLTEDQKVAFLTKGAYTEYESGSRQEVENVVPWVTVGLDNIAWAELNGVEFVVE